MALSLWAWLFAGLGGLLLLAALVVVGFRWLYVKVPANMAFIRTGLGGWKTVTDAGAFVLPMVHNIQWLSLETFKIEVLRNRRLRFGEISILYSARLGEIKLNPWRDGFQNLWFLVKKRFFR